MAVRIGSNIPALRTLRALSHATERLSSTYERLSTGQRINKASDDAAGLSVAMTLEAETRIYNQGRRNLNDGLSVLNIAQSVGEELSKIVTRMSELAEQSANGSYGNEQRQSMDDEAQALREEFNRIVRSTKFNGLTLLDGSLSNVTLQGGGNQRTTALNLSNLNTIFSSTASGQYYNDGTFQAATNHFTTSNSGRHILTADMNEDGNLDVITTSDFENRIHIAFGNGDGTFTAGTSFASTGHIWGLAVSDLNNDGHVDLVHRGTHADVTLDVSYGDGNGGFLSTASFAIEQGGEMVVLRDVNNDGIEDVITDAYSGAEADGVIVMLGNSDGSFQSEIKSLSTGVLPNSVDVGDVNGDGRLDVVTADYNGRSASVLLGNGDGTFQVGVSYDAAGIFGETVKLADLDGDGDLDMVLGGEAAPQGLMVRFNDGTGNFGAFGDRTVYTTNASYGPESLQLVDVNSDGNLDAITSHSTGVDILFGNGDGTFQPRVSSPSVNGTSLDVADVNNDSIADIISFRSDGGSFAVRLGNGDAQFSGGSGALSFSLETQAQAREALDSFTEIRTTLASELGKMGAVQNRLVAQLNVLDSLSINSSAAHSRIIDADIATEAAELTSAQIVQEVAASVLAQAKLSPQLALTLLSN